MNACESCAAVGRGRRRWSRPSNRTGTSVDVPALQRPLCPLAVWWRESSCVSHTKGFFQQLETSAREVVLLNLFRPHCTDTCEPPSQAHSQHISLPSSVNYVKTICSRDVSLFPQMFSISMMHFDSIKSDEKVIILLKWKVPLWR